MSRLVTFTDGTYGSVSMSGDDTAVRTIVAQKCPGKTIESIKSLPYPCSPMIHDEFKSLPLCFSPKQCAGRSSCPRNYSCSE